jgi:uncharacterized protein YebE (UPF0316 family)
MKNYAVVENGVVVNLVVAESLEVAKSLTGQTCIEYEYDLANPVIGLGYDGTDFEQVPIEE